MLVPDRSPAIRRAWGSALAVLGALETGDWSLPTRCRGWTLLDLARHGAWGTSMEADALRRARSGEPGSGEGVEPDSADPQVVLAALRDAVAALDGELARTRDLAPDTVVTIPFGPVPLAFALDVFTLEAGVHADDIADARRAPPDPDPGLDPEVVDACVAVLTPVLPALAAMAGDAAATPPAGTVVALTGSTVALRFAAGDAGWEPLGPEGPVPPPTASVTGDDTAVLRFALGRIEATDPRLDVRGAAAFKHWFPGP